jgi:hypothetical protein
MEQVSDYDITVSTVDSIEDSIEDPIEDADETGKVIFPMNKYDQLQKKDYNAWNERYQFDLCDRYLTTIDTRKKKLCEQNVVSVMEKLSIYNDAKRSTNNFIILEKSFIQKDTPIPKEKVIPVTQPTVDKKTWDMSWKTRPVVDVDPTSFVTTKPKSRPVDHSKTKTKYNKNNREPVSTQKANASQANASDISNEELISYMERTSPGRNKTSQHKQPSLLQKHQAKQLVQQEHSQQQPKHHRLLQPSAPIPQQPIPDQTVRPNDQTVKSNTGTRMCKFMSTCRRRDTCTFAHSLDEFSPVQCRFSKCRSFESCRFFHPSLESKQNYITRSSKLQQRE